MLPVVSWQYVLFLAIKQNVHAKQGLREILIVDVEKVSLNYNQNIKYRVYINSKSASMVSKFFMIIINSKKRRM